MDISANFREYIDNKEWNFYMIHGSKFNIPADKIDTFYDYVTSAALQQEISMHEYTKGRRGVWIDIDALHSGKEPILIKIYAQLCRALYESVNHSLRAPIETMQI